MNGVTPSWFSDFLLALLMIVGVAAFFFRHRRKRKPGM